MPETKERPIIFSAPMVRAILDGKKTQTRRVYKSPEPIFVVGDICVAGIYCPYGKPGERLWVRESCWIDGATNHVHYFATDQQNAPKKTPSIFMPRWASRITLEIVAVRVEPLQEISEADAQAEGVESLDFERFYKNRDSTVCQECGRKRLVMNGGLGGVNFDSASINCDTHKKLYRNLWESINGKNSWTLNPYVWCITFKRIENNA